MKISKEELLRTESITKKEFQKIAQFIDQTYPAKTKNDIPFLVEENTFNVWYELLKDSSYLAMKLGMIEYCLENKYAPALSDISDYTKKFTVKICEMQRIIKLNLEHIKWDCGMQSVEFTEKEKSNYYDLIFAEEHKDLNEYIYTSNKFVSFASWEVNKNGVRPKNLQELIDLWKDYWKKPKNPS